MFHLTPITVSCKSKAYNLANPTSFPGKKKMKRDPGNDVENNPVEGEVDISGLFTNTNHVSE